MATILKSRKFWLMIVDVVASTIAYFVGKLMDPVVGDNILWLIGTWQPVVIFVIVGITVEDAALKSNPNYKGPGTENTPQ